MDLSGKLVVITGAANGIGKAIAQKCASFGANCALIDINAENLLEVEQKLQKRYPSLQISAFICDVTSESQFATIVEEIEHSFSTNRIQMLFNNVGVLPLVYVLDGDIKKLRTCMDINLWSMIYGTRLFLPLLLNNDQNEQCFIVNTGSIASIEYSNSMYGITKHAVLAFTETISKELYLLKRSSPQKMKCNIHCACLCPAFVHTQIVENSAKVLDVDLLKYAEKEKGRGLSVEKKKALVASIGISTNEVMDVLFKGLSEKRGVIHTHRDWMKAVVKDRMDSIINGTPHRAKEMKKALRATLIKRRQQKYSKL